MREAGRRERETGCGCWMQDAGAGDRMRDTGDEMQDAGDEMRMRDQGSDAGCVLAIRVRQPASRWPAGGWNQGEVQSVGLTCS